MILQYIEFRGATFIIIISSSSSSSSIQYDVLSINVRKHWKHRNLAKGKTIKFFFRIFA